MVRRASWFRLCMLALGDVAYVCGMQLDTFGRQLVSTGCLNGGLGTLRGLVGYDMEPSATATVAGIGIQTAAAAHVKLDESLHFCVCHDDTRPHVWRGTGISHRLPCLDDDQAVSFLSLVSAWLVTDQPSSHQWYGSHPPSFLPFYLWLGERSRRLRESR